MKRKLVFSIILSLIILVIISALIANQSEARVVVGRSKKVISLIYPASILIDKEKMSVDPMVTFVRYQTYDGREAVQKYYSKNLKLLGWRRMTKLGREDMTSCGGDWGGTYRKEGKKIKLHVCGFGNKGYLTSIIFTFYNVEPEKVLGKDLTGGQFSCVPEMQNTEVKLVSVCATDNLFKINLTTNKEDLKTLGLDLAGKKWTYLENATVTQSVVPGQKEVIFPYDLEKWGELELVEITPILSIRKNNKQYSCNAKRIKIDIVKCEQ